MRAGVWTGPGILEYREWAEPTMASDEVTVRIHFCGMCGSDPHIIEGTLAVGPPPQVLGHEVSGVVEAVGEDVDDIAVGDRVACNFYAPCGSCAWCSDGQPNMCRRKFYGASGFAELATYKASQVFRLPEGVSTREGALLEPLATCLYALEQGELRSGENVLVIGGGTMGLLTAQLARRAGAGLVVVSELDPAKRDLATSLGADVAVDPRVTDLHAYAKGVGRRRGFDVVYDAAGAATATEEALGLLATRGRLVVIAVHAPATRLAVSPHLLYARELVVRSAYATAHVFPRAVAMLAHVELAPLITAVEPLSDITEVYRRHRAGEYTKVLLDPRTER
ncbi:MAG: alcohol dehydrogenase catalytic domain-containing protein [Nocardioidaceae bacterium]|nr:alcohol dehydrogenase catalytic domain-containing protein [Nocardioidaceae bacterium]